METWLSWDQGLVIGLAGVLFLVVVWLGRVLLLRGERPAKRRQSRDRRRGGPMPPPPFYDSERRLVTFDRRRGERRGGTIVFTTTQELRLRQGASKR
jgi:hypothetical protein